jgi:hypothetical protein
MNYNCNLGIEASVTTHFVIWKVYFVYLYLVFTDNHCFLTAFFLWKTENYFKLLFHLIYCIRIYSDCFTNNFYHRFVLFFRMKWFFLLSALSPLNIVKQKHRIKCVFLNKTIFSINIKFMKNTL